MISSLDDAKRVFGELTIKLEMNHDTQIVKATAYDDNDIIRWAGEEYFYINTINPTENPEVEALKAEIKALKAELALKTYTHAEVMDLVDEKTKSQKLMYEQEIQEIAYAVKIWPSELQQLQWAPDGLKGAIIERIKSIMLSIERIKTLKAEIADYERVEQKIMKIVRDNDRQGIYDMLLPIHYREEDV